MITSHPIKYGVSRSLSENLGLADLPVTYSVEDPALLSVDASGAITVLQDVTEETLTFIYVTDTATGEKQTCDIQIFPSSVDIDALITADGGIKSVTVSMDYPV
jgi:hypothetical protein